MLSTPTSSSSMTSAFFYDMEYAEEIEFKLVGSTEANSLKGFISNESPLGRALIGHKRGDAIEVESPAGMVQYKIIEIQRASLSCTLQNDALPITRFDIMRPAIATDVPFKASKFSLISALWCVTSNFVIWNGFLPAIEGEVFETKTGEKSVHASKVTLLAKSLQILPEKYHGLTNTDIRYRQRYTDLVMNPEVKDTFIKRSRIISSIRRYLDAKDFMHIKLCNLERILACLLQCSKLLSSYFQKLADVLLLHLRFFHIWP